MSSFVAPSRSRAVSRIALMAALAAGVAGCSSDFSRFSENPYRGGASQEVTGSVRPQQHQQQPQQQQAYQPAPSSRVESASLPPPGGVQPQQQPQQQYQQQQQSYGGSAYGGGSSSGPVASAQPTYGGGAGIGTYQPPARQEITGSVQAPRQPALPQLSQAPRATPPATRPALAAANGTHTIAPGETIYSLGRKYGLTPMAIAKANNVGLDHKVRVGDRMVIPGQGGSAPRLAAPAPQQQPVQRMAARPAPAPQQQPAPAPSVAAKPQQVAQPRVAQNMPPKQAQLAATANLATPAADPLPEPQSTGTTGSSSVSFRWPVRGHINEKFGPRPNGGQNDGINIAVPQGTPIKAAEDGVVAYSGSELKGYGNLVLVRHSNGYVTAYAHASELNVKKGESVKRGQVIGKAGQTGNVNSPQLHFEVRKGATPVDPTQYLTGG